MQTCFSNLIQVSEVHPKQQVESDNQNKKMSSREIRKNLHQNNLLNKRNNYKIQLNTIYIYSRMDRSSLGPET